MEGKLNKLGIRKEEFSKWERRVVLTPRNCKQLIAKSKGKLVIKIEPSASRIFSDLAYQQAGCVIDSDFSDCQTILGVKQIPVKKLLPNKTYIFFSHTIKAQEQNMEMLDHILKNNIKLIDYEKISNENGERLVAFGKFAGNSGAIDILAGLGSFLLNKGIGSPFLNIPQSYNYLNIDHAKSHIRTVSSQIECYGLNPSISPFIIGVTGTGRCSEGAIEILKMLPHEFIQPNEMKDIITLAKKSPEKYNKNVYIVIFKHEHMVESINKSNGTFNKKDYYANPNNYKGIFQEQYVQYLSVLINCIYWESKYPKLLTESFLIKKLKKEPNFLRLLAISDVTCDFMGSIDFLKKFTTIDRPYFVYEPETGKASDNYQEASRGILYNSIENMPSQFPLDASNHFGNELTKFIPAIVNADSKKPIDKQGLPNEILRAVITFDGKLTKNFAYISDLRKNKNQTQKIEKTEIKIQGNVINKEKVFKLLKSKFSVNEYTLKFDDLNKKIKKNTFSCLATIKSEKAIKDIILELANKYQKLGAIIKIVS